MARFSARVGGTIPPALRLASLSLAAATAVAAPRAQDPDDEEAEWLAFERKVEERLELEPVAVTVRGEALRIDLAFHGDLTLEDGSALAWDADLRRPYVRAALRWLEVLRGVRGREDFLLTLHFVGLSFDFGNGFASPLYESLEEVEGSWLPTEALIGINTFLYDPGHAGDPEIRKEIYDNALHEMGHAFGIGSLWNLAWWEGEIEGFAPEDLEHHPPDAILRQLVTHSEENEGLIYRGPAAVRAFQDVHGTDLDFVPISSDAGHLYALFDEEPVRRTPDGTVIPATDHELMSHRDVLSAISVAFLADLGWDVDESAADPLPEEREREREREPEPYALDHHTDTGSLAVVPVGDDPLGPVFAKRVDVFGCRVLATDRVPDRKLLHAAAVLAEYMDNDEDGEPDDALVAETLQRRAATLVMFGTPDEADRVLRRLPWDELEDRTLQDLYAEETHPGGHLRGVFDASYEEVLHLVTHGGYAHAYPEVFGERPGTVLADLMDAARGGRHRGIPDPYPAGAWYTYDDPTCEYECQVAEYVYWGITSLLGAQAFPGRGEDIEHEWRLETPEELEAGDPGLYALLTDPRWNLPRRLPDGEYRPDEEDR